MARPLGDCGAGLQHHNALSTGYSPHELFYTFAPSCPLDALVGRSAGSPHSHQDDGTSGTGSHLGGLMNPIRTRVSEFSRDTGAIHCMAVALGHPRL